MTTHKKADEPTPVPETEAEEAARLVHEAETKAEPVLDKVVEGAIHLVHMIRDAAEHPAPHTADVHPDEVENMKAGGWHVHKK